MQKLVKSFHKPLQLIEFDGFELFRNMVGIAQLVERLVVVQDVAGSSPVTHPDFLLVPKLARAPYSHEPDPSSLS